VINAIRGIIIVQFLKISTLQRQAVKPEIKKQKKATAYMLLHAASRGNDSESGL